jgi:hypothetical protein
MRLHKTVLALVVAASLAFSGVAAGGDSEVFVSSIDIVESAVLPGNVLPQFMFSQGSVEGGATHVFIGGGRGTPRPFTPDDSNPEDIFEGAMKDTRSPQLPYLTQDQWTCERTPNTKLPVVTLQNDFLSTNIAPSIAGKIWNSFDRTNNRDMFFANAAHQPANIGALKAWAAGGCEFNWSPGIIGHSAFSESPVFVAKMDTSKGPMVRVWEYDRYNSSVWQVDILHVDDELWIHPKITNPNAHDLRGYWWTCVAHHVTPASRVLSPADHVAETASGAVRDAPWPYMAETHNTSFSGLAPPLGDYIWRQDHSFLGNIIWGDFFLRIPDGQRRYIAHVEEDGYFVWHGHTLNGTKFFTWGQSGPGRFMQDFLSANAMPDRLGDYAELQVGPAPTQMQSWPLPAKSAVAWTEVFKAGTPAEIKPAVSQHKDHGVALSAFEGWMESARGVPNSRAREMESFFASVEDNAPEPGNVLFRGSSWGALNELLRESEGLKPKMAPGARFDLVEDDETRPWVELLRDGTFSEQTLARLPTSYQVSEAWRLRLEKSATRSETWLHHLHLGIIAAEVGMIQEPIARFTASFKLRPNAVAARNLALLQKTPEAAYEWFLKAWKIAKVTDKQDPLAARLFLNLGAEISQFLQSQTDAKWVTALAEFLVDIDAAYADGTIPADSHLRKSDQVLTAQIKVHLSEIKGAGRQPAEAVKVLARECFPTYGKARKELIAYWQEAHYQLKIAEVGRPLTQVEKRNVRVNNKAPRNIGCPYAETYCDSYW